MAIEEHYAFVVIARIGGKSRRYKTAWKLTKADAAARVASGEWLAAKPAEESMEVRGAANAGDQDRTVARI